MKVLAVIPARGGSKGIPRKNLTRLAGHPLLYYTISAALASIYVTDIYCSTDDHEILGFAKSFDLVAERLRPRELAGDHTPMLPVLMDALDYMESLCSQSYDYILCLQPTSPLRTSDHIDEAFLQMKQSRTDYLVSVCEAPHQASPDSIVQLNKNGRLKPVIAGAGNLLRQKKQRYWMRNGPAILIIKANVLRTQVPLYSSSTAGYVMTKLDSIDIDDEEDFLMAELLMRHRQR